MDRKELEIDCSETGYFREENELLKNCPVEKGLRVVSENNMRVTISHSIQIVDVRRFRRTPKLIAEYHDGELGVRYAEDPTVGESEDWGIQQQLVVWGSRDWYRVEEDSLSRSFVEAVGETELLQKPILLWSESGGYRFDLLAPRGKDYPLLVVHNGLPILLYSAGFKFDYLLDSIFAYINTDICSFGGIMHLLGKNGGLRLDSVLDEQVRKAALSFQSQ